MINDVMDTKEVAQLLRLHRKTVVMLANRGELPHFWVGKSLRFLRSNVEQHIKDQCQSSTTTKTLATV